MNTLIGDIGNSLTKICLIDTKNFKIKKIIYIDSEKVNSYYYLKKNLKKIIKNNIINKTALFSSVVPKYRLILGKFFKKNYKIRLIEIKEKKIKILINLRYFQALSQNII